MTWGNRLVGLSSLSPFIRTPRPFPHLLQVKRGFLNEKPKCASSNSGARKAGHAEVVPIPDTRIKGVEDDIVRPHEITFPTSAFTFSYAALPDPYLPSEQVPLCLLYPGAKEALLSTPNFPVSLPTTASLEPLYTITDVPGSGKGVFANATFQPGDLIMCERPLFILPLALPITGSNLLEGLVRGLSDNSRRTFYGLHNCKGDTSTQLKGIIDTNCLNIGQIPGSYNGLYGAVARDISHVNHSCTPNVDHRWHLDSLSFQIRALRTIQRGEQLFITYTSLLQSRAERQEELFSKYDFRCTCTSCRLSGLASLRSDIARSLLFEASRRGSIDTYNQAIKSWASDPSLPDDHATGYSLQVAYVMEMEGIYDRSVWPIHYSCLCKAYCALGDREQAIKWAKTLATLVTAFTGDDGGWNEVANAPERTDWWGLRSKFKK